MPVLLLHGKRDTIFSVQNSIDMAARIPKADLIVLDAADHILVLNRPREVGDALERFVHQLPARARSAAVSLRAQAATRVDDGDQCRTGQDVPDDTDGV